MSAQAPQAYRVHPLLDPLLPSRQRATARFWLAIYRSFDLRPESSAHLLRSFFSSAGAASDSSESPQSYFADADRYLDDLLAFAPPPETERLRMLPGTRQMNDLSPLMRTAVEGRDSRARYEAQRKLYLAKLLFDVDHCRSVRDGPRHRAFFEALLQRTLWPEMEGGGEQQICCQFISEGPGPDRFEVGVPPLGGARCWRFQLRRLPGKNGEPGIDIFHYRTRFKRDASGVSEERTSEGLLSLTETFGWRELGRRSGSILSKMIRRGIADPNMVQDLLGAMFIVGDHRQVHALERRLVRALGGPFRFRDRVDTLHDERDRDRLGAQSSSGFRVLKQIVDILIEDPAGSMPYFFPVEIQIYPLEAYLRTLHGAHFASHAAYKRRQFLHDLLPLLFPAEVYGDHPELAEGLSGYSARDAEAGQAGM